jgi:hypothetical protein
MASLPGWFPSREDLATSLLTSIITSALTAVFVFLITSYVLSSPISPTTEHEVSLVSAYPDGNKVYTAVVKNTGDFEEKDIAITVTNGSGYSQTARIPKLSPNEEVPLKFTLPDLDTNSFDRHNSTEYLLKNRSLAETACSSDNNATLESSNPIIRITEEYVSGEFKTPQLYEIWVEYPNQRKPSLRSTFENPPEYITSETIEKTVVPVNVTKEDGVCYFNDFPLFLFLDGNNRYVDYAPSVDVRN